MKKMSEIKTSVLFIAIALIILNGCKKNDEPIIKKDPVITWANPADIYYGTLLSATQLNATADVPGTFVYTPKIGTKLNAGLNQDLKVDFTPTNTENYNTTSYTVKINVIAIVKTDPIITWTNPADITLPTALSTTQLNATANIPGTFSYNPSIGTVLNIGENTALTVNFKPTDQIFYNNATKTVSINIKASGTVTDYDGNIYHTVVIGTQTWTVENLKVTHYRNGDLIPNITDNTAWPTLTTGAYCIYNNTETNKDIYGALYNWYAVTDSRNIAPSGWHVPTDEEWTTLTNFLGGSAIAGGKMKEYGTTHWTAPNTGGSNSSGLTILPCGDRGSMSGMDLTGFFLNLKEYGSFWSSTEANATLGFSRYIYYGSASIGRDNGYLKINGMGVRLVKD